MVGGALLPPITTRRWNGALTKRAFYLSAKMWVDDIPCGHPLVFRQPWRWAGMHSKVCLKAQRPWIGIFVWPSSRRMRLSWQRLRSEEHTSELQSLMRISYAVFCLKTKILLNIIKYIL